MTSSNMKLAIKIKKKKKKKKTVCHWVVDVTIMCYYNDECVLL